MSINELLGFWTQRSQVYKRFTAGQILFSIFFKGLLELIEFLIFINSSSSLSTPLRINGPSQESNLASMHLIHTAFYWSHIPASCKTAWLPQVSQFSSGNDFNMAKTFHWPIWKTGFNLWRKPKMATENEKEDGEGWDGGQSEKGEEKPL